MFSIYSICDQRPNTDSFAGLFFVAILISLNVLVLAELQRMKRKVQVRGAAREGSRGQVQGSTGSRLHWVQGPGFIRDRVRFRGQEGPRIHWIQGPGVRTDREGYKIRENKASEGPGVRGSRGQGSQG